jgi:DNA-binding Lrp family transcriptional regulator
MEASGIITGYRAVVDPQAVGRQVLAFIMTTVRYRVPGRQKIVSQRDFCREIAQHPLVLGVYVLSGEFDVLLKVRARDIDELNHFIVEFLREIPAVDKTLTMFAMETFLDSMELRSISSSDVWVSLSAPPESASKRKRHAGSTLRAY